MAKNTRRSTNRTTRKSQAVRDVIKTEFIVEIPEINVSSWSPGAVGEEVPPSEVHLIFQLHNLDASFMVRYKSKEAVDNLLDALIEHRDFVFSGGVKS